MFYAIYFQNYGDDWTWVSTMIGVYDDIDEVRKAIITHEKENNCILTDKQNKQLNCLEKKLNKSGKCFIIDAFADKNSEAYSSYGNTYNIYSLDLNQKYVPIKEQDDEKEDFEIEEKKYPDYYDCDVTVINKSKKPITAEKICFIDTNTYSHFDVHDKLYFKTKLPLIINPKDRKIITFHKFFKLNKNGKDINYMIIDIEKVQHDNGTIFITCRIMEQIPWSPGSLNDY